MCLLHLLGGPVRLSVLAEGTTVTKDDSDDKGQERQDGEKIAAPSHSVSQLCVTLQRLHAT